VSLTWVSVNARTGLIGIDLTDLVTQQPLATTIGQYETNTAALPLPKDVIAWAKSQAGTMPAGQLADWREATRPGASVAVALDEAGNPIWGGLILARTTDHTAGAVLSLATLEAYFDRRYCGDYTSTVTGENDIVAALIGQFIAEGTLPGLPIRVQTSGANTPRAQSYLDADDKTIYSVLQGAIGQGHPEWMIGWERQHAPERITPVLYVADRLGTAAMIGPNATFSLPGSVITASLLEDYTSGKGANRVTASSGQGTGRLAQSANAASSDGRPTFEYRWSPSDTISSTATLLAHAQRALAILAPGAKGLTLTANVSGAPGQRAPVLGDDWHLGDDVGYDLLAPAWIDGLQGVARCIGWERDDFTVTPILAVPDLAAA